MQQSSNPALKDTVIKRVAKSVESSDHMTVSGSLTKTGFLLAILTGFAIWTWNLMSTDSSRALTWMFGASIGAFIVALLIIFWRPHPILAMIYAAAEGIVIGSISFLFNAESQGIVLQATTLTLAITLSMLFLYATRMVTVTQKLRSVIIIATFGVLVFYLLTFIIGLFSSGFYEMIFSGSNGVWGVVIPAIIVIIAALNLLLDFDFIERGSDKKLPKQFEWYAGFSLMVTLVWLYISILRMLGVSQN